MLAEWSAECTAEDHVLVVPWNDPSGKAAFVDLRANPYDFDAIPEAEHYPPLMQALRALNATRSPVFSAKCDAWPMDSEEVQHLQANLDVSAPGDLPFGFASYIDLVARERSLFTSFPKHEQLLLRLTRLAAPLDYPSSALDCVLRPALLDLEGPQQGYAFSLYVKALGGDPQEAMREWGTALEAAVALIRSKDFSR
ncbi:MAG TPA: hypothetical protein VGN01_00290 [Acidobacteriaceae bacterium]|jgi:hypothetical protein